MVNTYSLVNNIFECRDCGHIGIFFAIDKNNKVKIKIKRPKHKSVNMYNIYLSRSEKIFLLAAFFILFLISPSLPWLVILFGFSIIIFKKIKLRKK